uniref:Uncharacterized protein n=1 Tax=Setaria italica TaxID=4555 RepID=K3Y0V4_SETIT
MVMSLWSSAFSSTSAWCASASTSDGAPQVTAATILDS